MKKIARIIIDEKSEKYPSSEHEDFCVIETWERGKWLLCFRTPFVKSAEEPTADDTLYLHVNFLTMVMSLINKGYTIIDERDK